MAEFKNLSEQLQRITNRIAQFSNNPSALSRDMVLEELRNCYDVVLQMPLTQELKQPVVPAAKQPEPAAPTPVIQKNEEEHPEVVAEVKAQILADETPSVSPVVTAPKPIASIEPQPAIATKIEKENNDAILAGKLNHKPIADLRSAIPLNEKFGIIKHLFSGNASDFGDAILKLNNSRSEEEMRHYFKLLSQRNSWDLESESYEVLSSYVERRAISFVASNSDSNQ
jgi:hypothetical protein